MTEELLTRWAVDRGRTRLSLGNRTHVGSVEHSQRDGHGLTVAGAGLPVPLKWQITKR
eukprot:COSAG01_NODE_68390_length_264_cov_0.630303_1_plen_57_part_01